MGYALLSLGTLGLIASVAVYAKADPEGILYDAALLGYIISYVVMVTGAWQVYQ